MTGSRLPLWATMAGVLVGAIITVGLLAGGVLQVPVARDLSDAQDDLVRAWERSRQGTFVVDSDFRRIVDGRTLYSPSQLVQRPPDRIVRQFGGVSGTLDGHPLVCSSDQNGNFQCTPGDAVAAPYDDVVQREVRDLRSYFRPPQADALPLYRVLHGQEPGCFELFRQINYPDAPYGTYGKLCFDAATGALRSLERHLDGGEVERQVAVSIRTTVVLGDFDTSSSDGFQLRMDLPDAPVVQGTPGSTPGTVPAPADVERLDLDELVLQGSAADDVARPIYVDEAVRRLLSGRVGINDAVWTTALHTPVRLAEPVVLELLRRGVVPPVPPAG